MCRVRSALRSVLRQRSAVTCTFMMLDLWDIIRAGFACSVTARTKRVDHTPPMRTTSCGAGSLSLSLSLFLFLFLSFSLFLSLFRSLPPTLFVSRRRGDVDSAPCSSRALGVSRIQPWRRSSPQRCGVVPQPSRSRRPRPSLDLQA